MQFLAQNRARWHRPTDAEAKVGHLGRYSLNDSEFSQMRNAIVEFFDVSAGRLGNHSRNATSQSFFNILSV
jgi:hypothetical protein